MISKIYFQRASLFGLSFLLTLTLITINQVSAQEKASNQSSSKSVKLEKVETEEQSIQHGRPISARKESSKGFIASDVIAPVNRAALRGESTVEIANGSVWLKNAYEESAREFVPSSVPAGAKPKVFAESPNDKWVAAHYHLRRYPVLYDKISIFDLAACKGVITTCKEERALDTNVATDIKFSADSSLLVFTSKYDVGGMNERTIVEVWETKNWKRLMAIEPPPYFRHISALAISPDSRVIAIGGNERFAVYRVDYKSERPDAPQRIEPINGSERIHGDLNHKAKSMLTYQISGIVFLNNERLQTIGEDGKVMEWPVIPQP